MRAVVQRVLEASVSLGDVEVSRVGQGLCVLVGISTTSTKAMIPWMARKLLNLRVFDNKDGKQWAANVMEADASVLLVSQFTLCHTLKGNKPDFHNALPGPEAEPLFNELVETMRQMYAKDKIAIGAFGEHMQVRIQNDGPVTLVVDAPADPPKEKGSPGGGAKQGGGDKQKKGKGDAKATNGKAPAAGKAANGSAKSVSPADVAAKSSVPATYYYAYDAMQMSFTAGTA